MAKNTTLTLQQVCALAEVSYMTVHTWRKGSATRAALPSAPGPAGTILVRARDLKTWTAKYGIALTSDPILVASGEVSLAVQIPTTVKKSAANKMPRAVAKAVKKILNKKLGLTKR